MISQKSNELGYIAVNATLALRMENDDITKFLSMPDYTTIVVDIYGWPYANNE